MHPIERELERRGLTQQWLVDKVVRQGGKLTSGGLSLILSFKRGVSTAISERMSKALGGTPTPAQIAFAKPPRGRKYVRPAPPSPAPIEGT